MYQPYHISKLNDIGHGSLQRQRLRRVDHARIAARATLNSDADCLILIDRLRSMSSLVFECMFLNDVKVIDVFSFCISCVTSLID